MELKLSHQLPEYSYIKICLEKISQSKYGLDPTEFINDLQILNSYQVFEPLKNVNKLNNLYNYIIKLQFDERKFFLNELIPFIANLALEQSRIWNSNEGLKILETNTTQTITLSKYQISVLIANMFLLSIPRRKRFSCNKLDLPPKICFDFIFAVQSGKEMTSKLQGIHNYFKRIYEKRNDEHYLNLQITFSRQQSPQISSFEQLQQNNQDIVLGDIEILNNRKIESYNETLSIHTDFANEYLGGGALFDGNVQEEILFTICPELLVGMIFSTKMEDNESILISGFEKFSSYQGYGSQFEITNEYKEDLNILLDKNLNKLQTYLTCIDATNFASQYDALKQYENKEIMRELIKCLAGFQGPNNENEEKQGKLPIVTGNWGCGMFNGDPQIKLIIQWIACSIYGRKIVYCSLNHQALSNYNNFICSLKGMKINKVLDLLVEYSKTDKNNNLYDFIQQKLLI